MDFDVSLNKYDVLGSLRVEVEQKYNCLSFDMKIEVVHENLGILRYFRCECSYLKNWFIERDSTLNTWFWFYLNLIWLHVKGFVACERINLWWLFSYRKFVPSGGAKSGHHPESA